MRLPTEPHSRLILDKLCSSLLLFFHLPNNNHEKKKKERENELGGWQVRPVAEFSDIIPGSCLFSKEKSKLFN